MHSISSVNMNNNAANTTDTQKFLDKLSKYQPLKDSAPCSKWVSSADATIFHLIWNLETVIKSA
jgi:hypothetical protein